MWPFDRKIKQEAPQVELPPLSDEQTTALDIERQIEAAFWAGGGNKAAAFGEVARLIANLEHRLRALEPDKH